MTITHCQLEYNTTIMSYNVMYNAVLLCINFHTNSINHTSYTIIYAIPTKPQRTAIVNVLMAESLSIILFLLHIIY